MSDLPATCSRCGAPVLLRFGFWLPRWWDADESGPHDCPGGPGTGVEPVVESPAERETTPGVGEFPGPTQRPCDAAHRRARHYPVSAPRQRREGSVR